LAAINQYKTREAGKIFQHLSQPTTQVKHAPTLSKGVENNLTEFIAFWFETQKGWSLWTKANF
jgi:hypothetical protein